MLMQKEKVNWTEANRQKKKWPQNHPSATSEIKKYEESWGPMGELRQGSRGFRVHHEQTRKLKDM